MEENTNERAKGLVTRITEAQEISTLNQAIDEAKVLLMGAAPLHTVWRSKLTSVVRDAEFIV